MRGVRDALLRSAGPSALSWPAFWVILVASAVGHLADAGSLVTLQTLPARGAIVLVSVAAAFGVMEVLRRPLLADAAAQRRIARVIALFAAGAAVRGLVLGVGVGVVLDDPMRLGFRVTAAITLTVPLLVVVAALVDAARTEAAQRAELMAVRRRLEDAETLASAEIAQAHADLIARIRDMLEQAVRDGAAATAGAAADALRRGVDTVIRPLSHELADAVPHWSPAPRVEVAPTLRWRRLWRDATLTRPFQPGAMAIVAAIMVTPPAVYRAGPAAGLATTVALGVAVAATTAAADALITPLLQRAGNALVRLLVFAACGSAIVAVGAGVVAATLAVVGEPDVGRSLAVAVAGVGVLLTILVACVQALFANARTVAADLAAATLALDTALARVHGVAWQQQRLLALAIHGSLQARVTAIALRIEQAAASGADPEQVMADARDGVLRALADIDATLTGTADIRQDLADIADAWQGVCAVGIRLDDDLAARIEAEAATAITIVDVCTEACSNAVRHAHASTIDIAIGEDVAGAIHLLVTNDGVAAERGAHGLGSRLLDEVAVSWERRVDDGGTALDVRLPPLVGALSTTP